MATQKIRIKLKAYDHNLIDVAAEKIVDTIKRHNGSRSYSSTNRERSSNYYPFSTQI